MRMKCVRAPASTYYLNIHWWRRNAITLGRHRVSGNKNPSEMRIHSPAIRSRVRNVDGIFFVWVFQHEYHCEFILWYCTNIHKIVEIKRHRRLAINYIPIRFEGIYNSIHQAKLVSNWLSILKSDLIQSFLVHKIVVYLAYELLIKSLTFYTSRTDR